MSEVFTALELLAEVQHVATAKGASADLVPQLLAPDGSGRTAGCAFFLGALFVVVGLKGNQKETIYVCFGLLQEFEGNHESELGCFMLRPFLPSLVLPKAK